MKKEIFICDMGNCKRECVGDAAQRLKVYAESTSNAAGGRSDRWHAIFNLCPQHLIEFTNDLLEACSEGRVLKITDAKSFLKNNGINFELI